MTQKFLKPGNNNWISIRINLVKPQRRSNGQSGPLKPATGFLKWGRSKGMTMNRIIWVITILLVVASQIQAREYSPLKFDHKPTEGVPVRVGNDTLNDFIKTVVSLNSKSTPSSLVVLPGKYQVNTDLSINANISLEMLNGAVIAPGTVKGSHTASNADTAGAGAISCAHNTTIVNGSRTSFWQDLRAGDYLTPTSGPCAGMRRQVKRITSNVQLELWSPFHASLDVDAGTDFTKSSVVIASRAHTLEEGDFITVGANSYYVSEVVDPNSFKIHRSPLVPFTQASWSRGVRVRVLGNFKAGRYQVCSSTGGVLRFGNGAVREVYPEWWGAANGNARAAALQNCAAINKAMWAQAAESFDQKYTWRGKISLRSGPYPVFGTIYVRPGAFISGTGGSTGDLSSGTNIVQFPGSGCHSVMDAVGHDGSGLIRVKDCAFQGSAGDTIHFCHQHPFEIASCSFISNWSGTAIWGIGGSGTNGKIHDNFIGESRDGIWVGTDSYVVNNEIAFNGPNAAGQYGYGICIIGGSDLITGNFIYSDWAAGKPGATIGIYQPDWSNNSTIIANNRLDNNDYAIVLARSAGLITGNMIYDCRADGIVTWCPVTHVASSEVVLNYPHIVNNDVTAKGYALKLDNRAYLNGGLIKNNSFKGTKGNIHIGEVTHSGNGLDWTLIEENDGIDIHTFQTFAAGDTQPSVLAGKRFKTNNSHATTITKFEKGSIGKEIIVIIGDSHTTFAFVGTHLKGHGGVNWSPPAGAHLRAVFDGTNWHCECYEAS